MNSKAPIYIFVASVVVAIGMLVLPSTGPVHKRARRLKSKLRRLPR